MIIALPLTTLMLSYYQRFIINKEKIKYDEAQKLLIIKKQAITRRKIIETFFYKMLAN